MRGTASPLIYKTLMAINDFYSDTAFFSPRQI